MAEFSYLVDKQCCIILWHCMIYCPFYSYLCVVFSDWRSASKVAARRGRPRAAESRSDPGAGGAGAPGKSCQGATGTAVAQKPQQEWHRCGTPTCQRLQQLILSLSLDSAQSTSTPPWLTAPTTQSWQTSMWVSPAHPPLTQRKTRTFFEGS